MNTQGRPLEDLASFAEPADSRIDWPENSWNLVREAGVLRWAAPASFGGAALSPAELLEGYAEIGRRCLTTGFILSQREAGLRYLLRGGNSALIERLAPRLAVGDIHLTLGISQLTTSRQHGAPAIVARPANGGYRIAGVMPWVTAADRTDFILTGAALEDGRQLLAVAPADADGLRRDPPLELLALRGSRTAVVHCDDVFIPASDIVAGPIEQVMSGMKGGTGGLETSALALGLCLACRDYVEGEAGREGRDDLRPWLDAMERRISEFRRELLDLAQAEGSPAQAATLRSRANRLALQSAETAMAAAKGTGFVGRHPAERFFRQAAFFLVWSCPKPALNETLRLIWTPLES